MQLILVAIFSLLIMSCGKHQQTSSGKSGVSIVTKVENAEVLSQSIIEEDLKAIEIFLATKGTVDYEFNSTGRTLITEACFWEKIKVIDFLVKKGAAINLKDKNGLSAEDYGLKNLKIKRTIFPELTISLKQSLVEFSSKNDLVSLKKLLEENPPVNFYLDTVITSQNQYIGETYLTYILKLKLENVLRLVAQPKFEIDPNLKNSSGEHPLTIAKMLNLKNSEKILVKLGARNE
ncbi:MAG: ankyrin repeat domain-containing protein [Bacteriovoracaceae bacterium]|nr:ankyrin repeat domain-containing protein [Bacteriovoracaceae bacterium]